ncbi:hypothetical protein JOQ06_021323, partial [Pogonophryne albipinna]
ARFARATDSQTKLSLVSLGSPLRGPCGEQPAFKFVMLGHGGVTALVWMGMCDSRQHLFLEYNLCTISRHVPAHMAMLRRPVFYHI